MTFKRTPFVFLALFAMACAPLPEVTDYRELTFSGRGTIALKPERLEIVAGYDRPLNPGHIEGHLPVDLQNQMQNWAEQRLATGSSGDTLRFTVTEASAVAETIRTDRNLTGFFTDEQAAQYTLAVAGRLEIVARSGRVRASASARASRSNSLPESASPNDRDALLYRLTEQIMTEFDRIMDRHIRTHLEPYLR